MSIRKRSIVPALAAVLLLGPVVATAQDTPAPPVPTPTPGTAPLTRDELAARLKAVEADTALAEPVRNRAVEHYRTALAELEQLEQSSVQTGAMKKLLADAPRISQELEAELSKPLPDPPDAQAAAASMSAAEVSKRLNEETAKLAAARDRLATAESVLAQLRDQPQRLRDAIAKARLTLEQAETDAATPAPADEPRQLTEAREAMLSVRRRLANAQLQSAQAEQLASDTILDLRTAERDAAARQVKQQERVVAAWRPVATRVVVVESAREAADVDRLREQLASEGAPEELIALARDTAARLGRLQELQTKLADAGRSATDAASRFAELSQEFQGTRERMQRLELDEQLGRFLRLRQRTLVNYETPPEAEESRRKLLGEASAEQLDIDDLRRTLPDREARVQAALASSAGPETSPFAPAAASLLTTHRQTLERLHRAYGQYVQELGNWIATSRDTEAVAAQYRAYISERLFWIRSTTRPQLDDVGRTVRAVRWLLAWQNWASVVESMRHDLDSPSLWIGLAAAAAMLWFRIPARRRLAAIAAEVGRIRTDSFKLTLRALLLTAAVVAGGPMIVGVIGWHLAAAPDAFARAVGLGLSNLALGWYLLAFARALCMRDGVGAAHFRWPDNARRAFARGVGWLMVFGLPVVFVLMTVEFFGDPEHIRSLGRLAFAVGMLAVALFFAIVLRPRGPVMGVVAARSSDGWVHRTRLVWFPIGVLAPLALIVLSLAGYQYTAFQLGVRVRWTVWLLAGLTILAQLLMRWLNVTHRRIAFEEALRKREAARKDAEAKAKAAGDPSAPPSELPPLPELDIPIEQLSESTRAMMRTLLGFAAIAGVYLIWHEVTPALNRLDQIQLWTYSTTVDGVAKNLPITLINVISAGLVAFIAFVAARNLPAVVELAVLNRLPIDAGARYAVSSVTRYVITGIGVVVAFRALGVGWGDVQWLVAALSIGLGFGLQEIIANFVSGLILLFERPIRVGDTVTIGDTTGTVTRIRIRATTIAAWDQKELIVPNKEFITARLLNWTLTDPVNRLTFAVGVAYGSDTRLTHRLLLEAAAENPLVLKDPAPACNFDAFGDNTLNFVLRVFLPDMTHRLKVIHELNTAINDKLAAAGIVIAFPQRDVHLDTAGKPLDVRWVGPEASSPSPPSSPSK